MAVHGFNITPEIEAELLRALEPGKEFRTYFVQARVEQKYYDELKVAAASVKHGHFRMNPVEVAMRVADKLVQKWKKQGLIKLTAGRIWVRV